MRLTLFMLLYISLSSFSTDYTLDEIYDVLIHVESNNNPEAIGDDGRAYGVLQIHSICVEDINRLYNTEYTHQQAFNRIHSKQMFFLYLQYGIKRFKRRYSRSPTEGEVVRMWNGSVYSGYKKESTKKYYRRYLKFKKLLI